MSELSERSGRTTGAVPETEGLDFRVVTSVSFFFSGGSLMVLSLFVPDYLRSNWLIPYGLVAFACFVGAALTLATRKLSDLSAIGMIFFADAAILVAASSQLDRSGGRIDAALLVMPTLLIAVLLPWRWLLIQGPATAACAGLILVMADERPVVVVVQALIVTISAACPAIIVVALRDQLAHALLQAREVATLDPLTGLLNRRGLDGQALALVRRARRQQRPLGVLVADLDHFKQVNDRFGHAGGDDVLRRMASATTECVRPDDVVARLGGEEFAVVTVLEPAALGELAERLRLAVEGAGVAWGVTASIGAASRVVSDDDDPQKALWSLIDEADDRMYDAKHAGRNQVMA